VLRALFLLIPFIARLCPAQCSLPKPGVEGLAQLPTRLTGFARYRAEALYYLDSRCYEEARASLERAAREPELRDKPKLQSWLKVMLEFTAARVGWNEGRLTEAKKTFNTLADEVYPADVNFRSVLALAELLSQYPDSAYWEQLRSRLHVLGDADHDIWRARHYLFTYGLNQSNASARIAELEQLLHSELPIRHRLENLFILGDVLRKSGRSTEALLLVTSMEDEMGKSAVDVELRAAYIRLCAALWDARARQGDPEAARLAQIYASALQQIYDPH
jgi:hypothetical protein